MGPLAAILISYVKQALKEKIIAYAKDKAMGVARDAMGGVPGASMLAMVPGMAGFAPRPGMPPEAEASLKAAGFYDTNAKPLTDAEWDEYEKFVTTMAKAGGEDVEVPDIRQMRTMAAQMPQMAGMLRMQLQLFQGVNAEQAKMREAYEQMSEPERQEAVDELVKTFREQAPEDQPSTMRVLESDALGLPEDLKQRLLVALKG
jgi:hypothetical protein